MPKIITYTDIQFVNAKIKKFNDGWILAVNYKLSGDMEQSMTRTFNLTDEQQKEIEIFISPYIKRLKVDNDLAGEEWSDAAEAVTEAAVELRLR